MFFDGTFYIQFILSLHEIRVSVVSPSSPYFSSSSSTFRVHLLLLAVSAAAAAVADAVVVVFVLRVFIQTSLFVDQRILILTQHTVCVSHIHTHTRTYLVRIESKKSKKDDEENKERKTN